MGVSLSPVRYFAGCTMRSSVFHVEHSCGDPGDRKQEISLDRQ